MGLTLLYPLRAGWAADRAHVQSHSLHRDVRSIPSSGSAFVPGRTARRGVVVQSKITPIDRATPIGVAINRSVPPACTDFAIQETIRCARQLIATQFILALVEGSRKRHVICVQCRAPQFDLRCLHHYAGCAVGDAQEWIGHLEKLLVTAPGATGDCTPKGLRS